MCSMLENSQVHVLQIWNACKEFQDQALIFSLSELLAKLFCTSRLLHKEMREQFTAQYHYS